MNADRRSIRFDTGYVEFGMFERSSVEVDITIQSSLLIHDCWLKRDTSNYCCETLRSFTGTGYANFSILSSRT